MADLKISELTTVTDDSSAYVPVAQAGDNNKILLSDYAKKADYQPLDSDLTAIAALSPANDSIIQRKAGAWVERTIPQLGADLMQLVAVLGHATLASVSDNATYYYGTRYSETAGTTPLLNLNKLVKDRTIRNASISIAVANNGSNESVPLYIRKNGTTDVLITNLDFSLVSANGSTVFNVTGLSISLLSTDTWEIKMAVPVLASNPSSLRTNVKLFE